MITDGRWADLIPIKRDMLEYPTENVSFVYLACINKIKGYPSGGIYSTGMVVTCSDVFIDKSVERLIRDLSAVVCRFNDLNNLYHCLLNSGKITADFYIAKVVNTVTTILASEAVDITTQSCHNVLFSVSGSTLKGYRNDLTTPKITVTDTTFASGEFGIQYGSSSENLQDLYAFLRPPSSQLPPALTIIEAEIIGSGSEDDPIRPNFPSDIRSHPEFGKIDKLSVTFGSFDYKGDPTMLCVIKGGNPYNAKAIETQILYAKSKNKIVEKPPKNLRSAEELYVKLKREFNEWIAGKHDFAYQTLGHADLEPVAVSDFYDGIAEGYYGKDPLKNVPEWELERMINRWMERLKRANVRSDVKDKHERKFKRVLKQ